MWSVPKRFILAVKRGPYSLSRLRFIAGSEPKYVADGNRIWQFRNTFYSNLSRSMSFHGINTYGKSSNGHNNRLSMGKSIIDLYRPSQ